MGDNDIGLRIKQLIDHFCDGNNSVFARNIGINEANIRNYLNGTLPKFDTLYHIVKNFDISGDWLITGKGSMLKKEYKEYNSTPASSLITANEERVPYNQNTASDKDLIIELKDSIIDSLRQHIRTLEEQSKDYRNDCEALRQDNKDIRSDVLDLRKDNVRLQQEINKLRKEQGKQPLDFIRNRVK